MCGDLVGVWGRGGEEQGRGLVSLTNQIAGCVVQCRKDAHSESDHKTMETSVECHCDLALLDPALRSVTQMQ